MSLLVVEARSFQTTRLWVPLGEAARLSHLEFSSRAQWGRSGNEWRRDCQQRGKKLSRWNTIPFFSQQDGSCAALEGSMIQGRGYWARSQEAAFFGQALLCDLGPASWPLWSTTFLLVGEVGERPFWYWNFQERGPSGKAAFAPRTQRWPLHRL